MHENADLIAERPSRLRGSFDCAVTRFARRGSAQDDPDIRAPGLEGPSTSLACVASVGMTDWLGTIRLTGRSRILSRVRHILIGSSQ